MLCRIYKSTPDLEPWLVHGWEWISDNGHMLELPSMFPGTGSEIIINRGDNLYITFLSQDRVLSRSIVHYGESVLICPRYANVSFSSSGQFHLLGLRLRTTACFELFGIPIEYVCDQALNLDDIGIHSPNIDIINENGVKALSAWITGCIQDRRIITDRLMPAVEMFYYGLPYDSLKERAGLNSRTLQRRFKRYVGVNARYFQRTARFQRTLRRILSCSSNSNYLFLDDYCDQSHFINACKFFTGKSPRQLCSIEHKTLNYYNFQVNVVCGYI